MAKKVPKGVKPEQAEFTSIDDPEFPLLPLAQAAKDNLQSRRKSRLDRIEEYQNNVIRDLRQFLDCRDDQMALLFNHAVWVFRNVIRRAIDIRQAEDRAREFNSTVDQDMQISFVSAEQNHIAAANAAVELLCKLGAVVSLDTVPLRIALSEMCFLITASPDLKSHHSAREVWPDIIHVVGRHLSSTETERVVTAAARADDVISNLRTLLPQRLERFSSVLKTNRILLVAFKKSASGISRMIVEALLRSDDLRIGLTKLCQEIYSDTRNEDQLALAASILRLNQDLQAKQIPCNIKRESNVYFVANGIYAP